MDFFAPAVQPSVGTGTDYSKPNVLRAQFGEGYSQRAQDGIIAANHVLNVNWELLTPGQADEIENFLLEHFAEPFQYQPALRSQIFVYTVLTVARNAADTVGNETISAQFQQERDPA